MKDSNPITVRCVAIDNDPLALQLLGAFAARVPSLNMIQLFEGPVAASKFLQSNVVDLLFMDVQMTGVIGTLLKSLPTPPLVIFTTPNSKFAFEDAELETVDYLLKPIRPETLARAVSKAEEYLKFRNSRNSREEHLYVYSEYKLKRIDVTEIEFIESLEDQVRIHLTSDKPVLSLMPLKKILEKLPSDKFMRVHRSYIVAVSKIRSATTRKVMLANVEVPVSESYSDAIRKLKKNL